MILNHAGDFSFTMLEKDFKTRVSSVNGTVHFTHHLIACPRRLRSLRLSLAGAGLITEKYMQTCTLGSDSGNSSVNKGNNGKIDTIIDVYNIPDTRLDRDRQSSLLVVCAGRLYKH